ncbi:hypothetical protein GCM10027578_17260 [Spirosoma luteolum]
MIESRRVVSVLIESVLMVVVVVDMAESGMADMVVSVTVVADVSGLLLEQAVAKAAIDSRKKADFFTGVFVLG